MRQWLALAALAGIATAVLAQDAPPPQKLDDLAREVENLKKSNAALQAERDRLAADIEALRREIEALRALNEESAREVLVLRQALRDSGGIPPASNGDQPAQPQPANPPVGPVESIRARVLGSNPEFGFVVIDKGEGDGVRPGFRFDIMRRVRVNAGDPANPEEWRWEKLGAAEFEKYLGPTRGQSKLKIVEGKAQDMKYEDVAVAQRKLEPLAPAPGGQAPAPEERKFLIKGKVGDSYMLNYGSQNGARQTDRVFVVRDGRVRAQLRLDVVERDFSVAKLIDKTQNGDFGEGDEVLLKEIKSSIVGRVRFNDEKHGIVIEAGHKNGVTPGMKFEVRRQGRVIGVIEIKKALPWTSEAVPTGELKREDVYVEDFVESMQ